MLHFAICDDEKKTAAVMGDIIVQELERMHMGADIRKYHSGEDFLKQHGSRGDIVLDTEYRGGAALWEWCCGIICENSISHSVLQDNSGLLTEKEQKGHGIGHKSVETSVEELGGMMEYFEKERMFCVHVFVPVG